MGLIDVASYLNERDEMSFHIKLSNFITPLQASNLIDGAVFAYKNGIGFSRAIHFNCSVMKVDSFVLAQRFSKLSSDWLRSKGAKPAYAWIRENPAGVDNLHWSGHVPDDLSKAFVKMQKRWVKEAGGKVRKNGILSQKIGIRPGERDRILSDTEYCNNLHRWTGYLLKGSIEDVCDELCIDHQPQGAVWGRRVGLSENISRKARLHEGFQFNRRGAPIHPSRVNLDRLPCR